MISEVYIKITHFNNVVEEYLATIDTNEFENLLKAGERFYYTDSRGGVMIAISDCKRIEWRVVEKKVEEKKESRERKEEDRMETKKEVKQWKNKDLNE